MEPDTQYAVAAERPTDPADPPTISEQMGRLHNRSEELEGLVDRLIDRASPFLVPRKDDALGYASAVLPEASMLAGDLERLEDRLYRVSVVLADTIDRVNW